MQHFILENNIFYYTKGHKINHSKVYNLVAFSTFSVLSNITSIWFQNIFITLKETPHPLVVTPDSSLLSSWHP